MATTPPRMRVLLDDPVFRAYMKKVPPDHPANMTGEPWQLWVRTAEGRWLTRKFETYRDAWPRFVSSMKAHSDVSLTSRRVFYAPPGEFYRVKVRLAKPTASGVTHRTETRWRQLFRWEVGLDWCGRCRRPVYWQPLSRSHHSLRSAPAMTTEDNIRCMFCGIRWIATPSVDTMVKL